MLFEERSSSGRFSSCGQIPAGISPERRFPARWSLWSCWGQRSSLGIGPERELRERSRFCKQARSTKEGGRGLQRLFPWRKRECREDANGQRRRNGTGEVISMEVFIRRRKTRDPSSEGMFYKVTTYMFALEWPSIIKFKLRKEGKQYSEATQSQRHKFTWNTIELQ